MKKIFVVLLLLSCNSWAYQCDGRTRCSQMRSCEEATWFLNHCPNTTMDGDHDGVPCESQWCDGESPRVAKPEVPSGEQVDTAPASVQPVTTTTLPEPRNPQTDAISILFRDHKSGQQVLGSGTVEKILPDDSNGSRHQRIIVRTNSGIMVLVAHNIDLAPPVANLAEGENIVFYGEYEWSDKGGTIHWTHHDPANQHVTGWIRYRGNKYQ